MVNAAHRAYVFAIKGNQPTVRLAAQTRLGNKDRYFITNRVFPASQALALVRLHWGIENGPNWTMDMQLGEDDGTPCRNGRGVAVTGWLRSLAYNLLSMWRRKVPPGRDEGITTWARAMSSLQGVARPQNRAASADSAAGGWARTGGSSLM